MNNKEPQYETMPEHYVLCFNDECALADECLHRLAARSGRQKDEVVTLKGTVVQPKTSYEAVLVGANKTPKPLAVSVAQFPVSAEVMEKIGHGISKLRLSLLPVNHERSFKKDKMGLKLYQSYLETKAQEENF